MLAGESHIAGGRDDLDLGSQDLESEVETHLVIAGTGRSVGHGIGPDLLGILDDGYCLEYTFRGYRYGISAVAEHIARYHVANALVVIIACDIEGGMGSGTQIHGTFLDTLELLGAEASGVGYRGVYLISEVFREILGGKRGVETATEGENYFLFHFYIVCCGWAVYNPPYRIGYNSPKVSEINKLKECK